MNVAEASTVRMSPGFRASSPPPLEEPSRILVYENQLPDHLGKERIVLPEPETFAENRFYFRLLFLPDSK